MKSDIVNLPAFKIAGFIEFSGEDFAKRDDEISYSSWGEEEEKVCPFCGEDHSAELHDEINWEELYLPHKMLKKNLQKILGDSENIINDKKYEIIKYAKDINSTGGFNLVGLMVRDLNSIPYNFIGMRFPERSYLEIKTTMKEFYNSTEIDELIHKRELDEFCIIEYELKTEKKFNELEIVLYYPLKE